MTARIPSWRRKQIEDAEDAREQRALARMANLCGLNDDHNAVVSPGAIPKPSDIAARKEEATDDALD